MMNSTIAITPIPIIRPVLPGGLRLPLPAPRPRPDAFARGGGI